MKSIIAICKFVAYFFYGLDNTADFVLICSMDAPHTPLFFEEIETFCPICREPVKKVIESRRKIESPCQNEFYAHTGRTLVKFKDPAGAWEQSEEYKLNAGTIPNNSPGGLPKGS